MTEYGLFNDEASDYTAEEAIEAGFYSREAAERALREDYSEEDQLEVHEIEEEEEEEEDEEEDEDDDDGEDD